MKPFATVLISFAVSMATAALESGELIPSGTADGSGPLAAHAVITEPLGAAYVTGATEPDLFVQTGRFGREKGLFLYPYAGRGPEGQPAFKPARKVHHPFQNPYPPHGCLIQLEDESVHALFLEDGEVVHCILRDNPLRFDEQNRILLPGLPRNPQHIGAIVNDDDSVELLLAVSDGTRFSNWEGSTRSPDYRPYDGRGIWQGGWPYASLYAVTLPEGLAGPANEARRITPSDREVRLQYGAIATVALDEERRDIITGSHFGPFHYYDNTSANGIELSPRRHLVDAEGTALRHPTIHPTPTTYPKSDGVWTDLIAGGEGGLYWYRYTGLKSAQGKPIYDEPVEVLEQGAKLYAGTLPVPNVVDWDGDGDKDIVAGNSEGYILFFENTGGDTDPRFQPGQRLKAGGETIHVQPGYRGDIQGPGEARWGYVCPTVVDWDEDGSLDIVMSDSTARHTLFRNEGSSTAPKLSAGAPIYYDGVDLYGTWRVQPAAGKLGDRMAYIALDDDDEFRLYWQEDARNVTDGGKLKLDTGEVIGANFLNSGGSGRLKIVLYDWNDDGNKDLIVGTPRHGSVPNPDTGLPQSLGLPGSAVLFLENTGSNAEPKFGFPKLFAFKDEPIFLGQHACGPAVADFGQPEGPGLIVGEEGGRLLYFAREDLSTITPEQP